MKQKHTFKNNYTIFFLLLKKIDKEFNWAFSFNELIIGLF